MKLFVCFALIAVAAATPLRFRRGVIHDFKSGGGESLGASGFHHEVEHEHAKSHQSVKLEHFHPVPVYVKKEHAHLLKHPLEKGKSGHGIKLIHPKTEHHHGYGLVLEEHRHDLEHDTGLHGFSDHSDDISQIEHIPEQHEYSGYGGGEESHGWAASEGSPSYETKALADEGHYQYKSIDLSHLSGHEAESDESY